MVKYGFHCRASWVTVALLASAAAMTSPEPSAITWPPSGRPESRSAVFPRPGFHRHGGQVQRIGDRPASGGDQQLLGARLAGMPAGTAIAQPVTAVVTLDPIDRRAGLRRYALPGEHRLDNGGRLVFSANQPWHVDTERRHRDAREPNPIASASAAKPDPMIASS
ncbi:MAG: hypothetical protein QJR12_03530 [Mycobacterium sp.]|uniref:hypothetical protein n=1 Tax=Mycobacterium sp. TaxID=1785 RepID=UPI002623F11C|nr:hypothetical protein [Mycobacterium sp.]MDI3313376.1 hypothetical protein [Mycobacterium sp.]